MNLYFEKYITSSQALFGKGTSFLSQNQMGEGASYKLFFDRIWLCRTFPSDRDLYLYDS